jgi:hypothetical protein
MVASGKSAAYLIAGTTLYRKDVDIFVTTVDNPNGTGDVLTLRFTGQVRHVGARFAHNISDRFRIWADGGAAWAKLEIKELNAPQNEFTSNTTREAGGWFIGAGCSSPIFPHFEVFLTIDYDSCIWHSQSFIGYEYHSFDQNLGGSSVALGVLFSL